MKNIIKHTGLLAAAMLYAQASHAAIITLTGNTVDFIFDDSQPGIADYGVLQVVGDSIVATPNTILAQAADGGSASFSVPETTVTVVVHSGYQFSSATVGLQGDYTVAGAGASVSISNTLTVSDTSNAATSVTPVMTDSGFGSANGTYNWTSVGTADLSTAMWSGVNSINLSLASILSATTSAQGESALIQEKFTGSSVVSIQTVPLPAAVWLMGSGLLALFGLGKRKS